MTPRRARDIGRTLVVLRGGPYNGAWYWRDDLEQVQRRARRFPSDHPSAVMGAYHPSRSVEDYPAGFGTGEVWRYTPAVGDGDAPPAAELVHQPLGIRGAPPLRRIAPPKDPP